MKCQNQNRVRGHQHDQIELRKHGERSYHAEVRADQHDEQSRLIEHLIVVAFDLLGARHLDVRVCPGA
jgi:hypothetical protein